MHPHLAPDHPLRGSRPLRSGLLLLVILLTGCQSRQLIDTPNLYTMTGQNPFLDTPAPLRNNQVDILYATDRMPEERRGGGREYGYRRSKSLAYGQCVVNIGKDVPWDQLVENSLAQRRDLSLPLTIQSISELGRFPATPLPLVQQDGGLVEDPNILAEKERENDRFRSEISRRLSQTPVKEAFVFIHGYNNTFDHSVYVMADLWHFMGRRGIPVVYSWPAGQGGLRGYNYDRESGEFTVLHLKHFLKLLASCPDLERIHLLAHSRGTDVLSTALREIVIEARAAGKSPRTELKIGNLALAAPDLDMEVFSQRITGERVGMGLGTTTLYVSEDDKALGLSTWLFSGIQRVGRVSFDSLDPFQKQQLGQVKGASVVDARVRSGFVGHSYFYANPAVSSDLILFLGQNRAAGSENGRPLIPVGPNFWRIEKFYPGSR